VAIEKLQSDTYDIVFNGLTNARNERTWSNRLYSQKKMNSNSCIALTADVTMEV
jgi:ABC-type amino acid transport substrate-binding protein